MLRRRQFVAALAAVPVLAACARALPAGESEAASDYLTQSIGDAGVVPVVGIGTARLYQDPQTEQELAPLRATLARFAELGGQVIDTAPSYGRAEEVLGQLISELGIRDSLFLATKVGVDTADEGREQIEQGFRNLRTDYLDLVAVHNLRDVDNQLALLRELQQAGRIGSVGITTSFKPQYEAFEEVMRREPLDCIQIDYALDNRSAAERILPLAQEQGTAVMINLPFGRERLFEATAPLPLPDWAAEIEATSWAQVFLKYIISHPSRPIPIPGTGQVNHVEDNLAAARGPLPDADLRRRMERFIDAL